MNVSDNKPYNVDYFRNTKNISVYSDIYNILVAIATVPSLHQ